MPTPSTPRKWKIKRDVTGKDAADLFDCEIDQNEDGTYEFRAVLARAPGNTLPFTFPEFVLHGLRWNITVHSLTHGEHKDKAHGTWRNFDISTSDIDETGTWTSQAGSGPGEESGEEDAASASA